MSQLKVAKGKYQATFDTQKGMNFLSFKKGEIEAIDQSTYPLFEERCAGLGAMIGPHFHHRKVLPAVCQGKEPYSHGIGRYVPWEIQKNDESHILAALHGDLEFKGQKLKEIEGFDFKMRYEVWMREEGMEISLSVVAENEAVVGLHTYYALNGGGRVEAKIANRYNDGGTFKPLPAEWNQDFVYDLDQPCDYGFLSNPGDVRLITKTHEVHVQYSGDNSELSWQLWHPEKASFACVEPIAAQNPRKPKLSVNSIRIFLSIANESSLKK